MSTKVLQIVLVIFGLLQLSECFKSIRQDNITDRDGKAYKLGITTADEEEDIEVIDSDGKRVLEVDFFAEGYVLDKPENDTNCYLSEDMKSDKAELCYSYVTMPKENVTDDILKKCEGRNILLLISDPDHCENAEQNESPTKALTSKTDNGNKRVKRWFCSSYYMWTLRSVRVRYCCRRIFGWCVRSCYHYRFQFVWVRLTRCL